MNSRSELELVPNQRVVAKPVFEDDKEYQVFFISFYEEVRDSLERLARARQQTEQEAMRKGRS